MTYGITYEKKLKLRLEIYCTILTVIEILKWRGIVENLGANNKIAGILVEIKKFTYEASEGNIYVVTSILFLSDGNCYFLKISKND